ncbi:MAG: NfeD family protein [Verrucomicrobiales bacterium]|nr:NfeD family protein [Verrucomicrobiales bacterium]
MMTPCPRRFLAFILSIALPLHFLVADADEVKEEDSPAWQGKPVLVSLGNDDLGDGRRLRDLERLIQKVENEEASVLIFDLDISAQVDPEAPQLLLDLMADIKVETVAYVNSSAIGPGALLALAADSIYLTQSGIIGSAGLSSSGEDEMESEAHRQKASVLKARARSLAKIHGHRVDVVEAMIDESREVKVGEAVISKKGEVLTLTADEAIQKIDGKPLLADGIVESVEELLLAFEIEGPAIVTTPRAFGELSNRERLSKAGGSSSSVEEASEEGGEAMVEDGSLFGRRDEGSYQGKVIVLRVGQDTLATGKASFDFMDRTIKKAELDGAAALVFDMDTPGGFAWYTEGLVLNSLQNVSYPTYTFVNSRAESAGAIIAVGTDHIYMRPAATIGSALVVGGSGQDLAENMADKVTQMIIGTVRNVAELKGHNPDVAEAFVTRDKEVRIDGVIVHEAGNVLNLNTIRATEEIGGAPVLSKGVVSSVEELLKAEGITADVVMAEPLGLEAFAHWVQKLSILLIVVGLAGAYMELNSPGFGLPGLVSVLAFSLFFFGNYLAGNLAGYELAVLLILGLILLGVEVFLFPGAVIPGAIGGALVLVALGLAMVDRVDLEWKWTGLPGAETWYAIFRESFIGVSIGLVGALLAILLGMRFLPDTKLGSRMILQEAIATGAALGEQAGAGTEAESFVGWSGKTTTDLVPSGKGRFNEQLLDIVSDGEFIARGASVVVTRHEGSRVVVAKA